jgi:cytochrome c-type biogenesis protein CcmH
VGESTTPASAAIRRQIGELLAAGSTPDQVRSYFVDRYGQWILLNPSSPVAWVTPFLAILGATLLLSAWLWRSSRRAAPAAAGEEVQPRESAVPPEALRQVREEAEALDA